jgi:hypothetical protein
MGLFDINLERYGLTIIPPYLRRAVTIAYTKSQLNPLITSKQTYLTDFRAKAKDDAIRNAQKIMLEDRLNIDFNTTGIYIETFVENLDTNYFYSLNEVTAPPVYFYSVAEAPITDDTIFMYSTPEYVVTNNFTVFVPSADAVADPELIAKVTDNVNKYKVAGTTFDVQQY